MPNHCSTDMTIAGPIDVVNEILEKYITEEGCLNCDAIIPYPVGYKVMDDVARDWDKENRVEETQKLKEGVNYSDRPRDGFNSGGYEWCIENWGTKWGTYDGRGIKVVETDAKKVITLTFHSAWSPPTPVFAKLSEMYPSIRIEADSYEGGMGYRFTDCYKDGVNTLQLQESYDGERGG